MDLAPPTVGGVTHPAYANPRGEVAALVPPGATRVLDVGCSVGSLSAALAASGHRVTGIELDPGLAAEARRSGALERLVVADVEAMAAAGTDPGGPFDCVVLADVLEHLRDPWAVARWAAGLLAEGGCLVISVPNVRHLQTFWSLLVRRRWPYEAVGIFDRTHLRWFARANLPDLLEGTGLAVTALHRTRVLALNRAPRLNRLAPYLGDLGTLQFVFRAELPAPVPSAGTGP